MALAGKNANLKVAGTAIAFTDEATATSNNLTYQIVTAIKRIWDRTVTIVVEDGGIPTVEAYTINRLNGTVVFGSAVVRVITVTGSYIPVTTVIEAMEYSYSLSADNLDVTIFSNQWIRRIQGLKDISGSISRFKTADMIFLDYLTAGTVFIIEFYSLDSAAVDVRTWAILASDEVSAAVDGVVEDSLEFEGSVDQDGNSISTGPF